MCTCCVCENSKFVLIHPEMGGLLSQCYLHCRETLALAPYPLPANFVVVFSPSTTFGLLSHLGRFQSPGGSANARLESRLVKQIICPGTFAPGLPPGWLCRFDEKRRARMARCSSAQIIQKWRASPLVVFLYDTGKVVVVFLLHFWAHTSLQPPAHEFGAKQTCPHGGPTERLSLYRVTSIIRNARLARTSIGP